MKPLKDYYNNKKKNKDAILTPYEKKVVSALKKNKVRDQDITYILNIGRRTTLNHARIGGVSDNHPSLTDDELRLFEENLTSLDLKTGLNPAKNKVDYLLVKSKNAIIQAVSSFNSPRSIFSIESFLVLSNISWLYLLQAYCLREKINYKKSDGSQTQSLLYLITENGEFKNKSPLSKAIIENIKFLIELRDFVSHDGLQIIPAEAVLKLQANCVNYNNVIKKMFGDRNGVDNIFSIALQFASISLEQSKSIIKNSTSTNLLNFVSEFESNLDDDVLCSEEYQFTVTYLAINEKNSNKADVVRFITKDTEGFDEIKDVLIKEISEDNKYIYMMQDIVKKSKKTQHQIVKYIKDNNLRTLKPALSNNKKFIKPYPFGKQTMWKYTEDFLQACIKDIKDKE